MKEEALGQRKIESCKLRGFLFAASCFPLTPHAMCKRQNLTWTIHDYISSLQCLCLGYSK